MGFLLLWSAVFSQYARLARESRVAKICAIDFVIFQATAVALDRASRPERGYGRRVSMATSAPWRRLHGSSCFLPPSGGASI